MTDDANDGRKRRLEGVIPEIIKRAVERGVEKAVEAPGDLRSFVNDLKLPKEIVHYIFSQVDDTKNGLFRVVAKEMRDFLEHTNFAGEMQKLLTTVQFEINTTIRFSPNVGTPPDKEKGEKGEKGEGDEELAADASAAKPVTNLPRPEVKTDVRIGRDRDRDRDEKKKRKQTSE